MDLDARRKESTAVVACKGCAVEDTGSAKDTGSG